MRVFWLPFFAVFLATSANAQTSVLRSGEHSEFTRLTLRLPSGTEWSADLVGRQLSISLEGNLRAIDTASVFRRISRDRIANVVHPTTCATLLDAGSTCSFKC